mmetsp:Transcript_22445/g.26003  ORF Transcript_22445/g.26003 Transcript_22445/m.26003 type:complete len:558 (+) Transcript_22445:161-1834(+)
MSKPGSAVLAGHGGIIQEPNRNDVLSGRGGRINAHPGNVQFRDLVKQYRGVYLSNDTKKLDKVKIATKIVNIIRCLEPSGRFLKEEKGGWIEIGDEKAKKKAGQAMREKAEETRKELEKLSHPGIMMNPGMQGPNSPMRYGQNPGMMTMPNYPTSPMGGNFARSPNSPMGPNSPTNHPGSPTNHPGMPPVAGYNYNMYGMPGSNPYQMAHMQQQQHGYQNQLGNMAGSSPPQANNPNYNPPATHAQQRLGLLVGNAAAFDREFNRMASSSSADTPGVNSLVMSSMEGSFNSSASSNARSSLTSEKSSGNETKHVQILEPISDEREHVGDEKEYDDLTNQWEDSWDQGIDEIQSMDHSSSQLSVESERRKRFRQLKSEPSCLPSQLPDNGNIGALNENDLMKDSIASVEMRSMEMRKSNNKMAVSSSDMKMDSVSEFIVDTLIEGSSSGSLRSGKKSETTSSEFSFPTILSKPPKPSGRTESGTSELSDNSMKYSEWIATANTNLPDMSDLNRQRLFSDYSNRSTSNMSEISVSMGNLGLTESTRDFTDDSLLNFDRL